MRNRIIWIDYAKTMAIYLVILGHLVSINDYLGIPRLFIYSFHMPFFFFVSGMLTYKIQLDIKHLIKTLIVPYFSLNFIAFCLWLLQGAEPDTLKNMLKSMLIGESHSFAGPSWFLLCLFFVNVFFYSIKRISVYYQFVFMMFGIAFAYFVRTDIWWGIDSALMALPFFYLGNKLKDKLVFNKYRTLNMFIGVILLILNTFLSYYQGVVDVNLTIFGISPFLYYPISFIGILMLFFLSSIVNIELSFIKFISNTTIIIMALHGCVFSYALKISNALPLGIVSGKLIFKQLFVAFISFLLIQPISVIIYKYAPFLIGRKSKSRITRKV